MICGAVLAAIGVPREAVVEDYALSKRDLDAWFVQAIAASDRARKLFESATHCPAQLKKRRAREYGEDASRSG